MIEITGYENIGKGKPDLTSTEISKSLDFVNKCMKSYPEWKKR